MRQASDILAIAALHRIASTIGRNTNCRHAQSATDLIDVFNLLHFFVFFVSFCSKMSPLPYTRYSPKLIGSTVGQGRSQQMAAGTSPLSFVTCATPCSFDRPRPVRTRGRTQRVTQWYQRARDTSTNLSACHRHKTSPEDGIAFTARIHSTVRNTSSQAFPKITIVTVELTRAMH